MSIDSHYFQAGYLYATEAEMAAVPRRGSLRQANEDADKLPAIQGASVIVAQYEVDSEGLSNWIADYLPGQTKPFCTADD